MAGFNQKIASKSGGGECAIPMLKHTMQVQKSIESKTLLL